jgi:hypothetical protein
MEQLNPLQGAESDYSSPKFFKRIDDWLLRLNLGYNWRTYFVLRATSLADTILFFGYAVINLSGQPLNMLFYIIGGPIVLFFYALLLCQWRLTRILVAWHLAVVVTLLLIFSIYFIVRIFV